MTTTKRNLILPRSSRRLKRTALPIASSRVDSDKWATAQPVPSLFDSFSQSPNPLPLSLLQNPSAPCDIPIATSQGSQPWECTEENIQATHQFLKPRSPLQIAAFNVRTLMQIGQQACLARTLDSLGIDVCCVSETRIQDPTNVIQLTAPDLSRKYFLRTSGDDEARAAGHNGVRVLLNKKLKML